MPSGSRKASSTDFISACLGIAVGIKPQLWRVTRWSHVRNIAVAEVDAHAIKHINASDVIETLRGREETVQDRFGLLPDLLQWMAQAARVRRTLTLRSSTPPPASNSTSINSLDGIRLVRIDPARRHRKIVEQTGAAEPRRQQVPQFGQADVSLRCGE